MIIKNVNIFQEDHVFRAGVIYLQDGKIEHIQPESELDGAEPIPQEGEQVIDGHGCYAIPGMIDLHFHGCMGSDVCDATEEALHTIARYEASIGVTAISPATMTLSGDELVHVLENAATYKKKMTGAADAACEAELVGINMEGPFISKAKKGAQDERNIITCDVELFHRFQRAADGLVKFIGIAPEEPGAIPFVDAVKDEVSVSLAHTNSDYEHAMEAFSHGANHAVHLYNAMPPFTHRAPGVVGAVADNPHVMAEMICDGVHIHPSVVRATFAMLGKERMILISDSMRATGMPDGTYTLGGLDVSVNGNRATLVDGGALAGSVTNLMDCMRTVVKVMEIPLETAVACATANPAKSLGVYDTYGSISAGKKADIVLLDEDLDLKMVIKDGQLPFL